MSTQTTAAETIGAKFQELRENRGVSLEHAARRAGMTGGALLVIERGLLARGPGAADLRKLAAAYEINVVEMMIMAGHIEREDLADYMGKAA